MTVWQQLAQFPQAQQLTLPEASPQHLTDWSDSLQPGRQASASGPGPWDSARTGEKALMCLHALPSGLKQSSLSSYLQAMYSQPSLCSEPTPSLPLSWCPGPPYLQPPSPKCKQLPGRSLGAGKTHLPRVTKHRRVYCQTCWELAPHNTINSM